MALAAAPAQPVTKGGTGGRTATATPWRKDPSSQGFSSAGSLGPKRAPGPTVPSDPAAISRWVVGAPWALGSPPATSASTTFGEVTLLSGGKPTTGPPPSQPEVAPGAVAASVPSAAEAETGEAMSDVDMPPGQAAPLTPHSTAECAIPEAEHKGLTDRLTAVGPLVAAAVSVPDLQHAWQAEA